MVKIPKLEEDGQNWKIYREKYLEVAATENLLSIVAGWESDDGSKDWDHRNRVARMLLYITLPPLLQSRIRLLERAQEVFRYLAYYFLDAEPIADPRAKKLATCANVDKRYPSAEAPMSENAAAERHAHAEREDPPTKDLTRGIEDVDDGNVGREDPRTSLEASAMGSSANSTETTLVVLESAPHETQSVPQNSLPLTPGECKQEAADGVVTAGRTNGTAQSANPPETDADVDRTALLGREPAERVCGVDEGDETDREYQSRIQQTNRKKQQRNANANMDVPSAHKLPLEGEWTVYASGEDQNLRADRPSESKEAEDTAGVQSEGCEGGTSWRAGVDEPETVVECCQQLCMADGDGDRGVEPADGPNQSEGLVTVSIESESPDGDGIPRVHLGSTSWRAGDANGPGNQADASNGQTDESKGWTDALNASNHTETAGISCDEGAGAYLGARGAKRVIDATDGVGSQSDASSGHWDVPSVETDAITAANATETVSIPPKPKKPPDLPGKGARWAPDEPNGYGTRADTFSVRRDTYRVGNDTETPAIAPEDVSIPQNEQELLNLPMETARWTPDAPNGCTSHAGALSARTDVHCVGNATETAGNEADRVRTRRMGSVTRNSPNGIEIATPKPTIRWKKVSAGGIDVYVPQNAPIKAPSRKIVFGRPESGDEAIAPSVEGERAGDGDGDGNGGDGDDGHANGTTSGGDADSTRVEAALLAAEGQHTRYIRISRRNNLPVSSGPPIQSARRPYGLVRRQRRRGRLKIERIKVSKAQQDETAYLGRAHATQPPGNYPNQAYRVIGLGRRRGRIKIAPTNVSRTRNGGNTYLRRVIAMRSNWKPKKDARRLDELTFDCRMQGERRRGDGDYG